MPRNPGPQSHIVKQLPWIQSLFWMQIDDSSSNDFCVYHAECSSMLGADSLPFTLSYVCSLYSHIVCSLNDHIDIWYATDSYLIPIFFNSHLFAVYASNVCHFPLHSMQFENHFNGCMLLSPPYSCPSMRLQKWANNCSSKSNVLYGAWGHFWSMCISYLIHMYKCTDYWNLLKLN